MVTNWRAWVLLILVVGPILAYMGFGALWLAAQGWLLIATAVWVVAGILFAVLAERWTKARRPLLPPLDWEAPQTFSPFDREAWKLVVAEAERAETVALEALSGADIYIETGRELARRLAAHYHPLSHDPIEHVPIIELLTALELAAEDLAGLCRGVPGGDLITPAHWKRAVVAAGYIQKANDIYTYLLPIFQPMTGLVRLGTQKLMVQPAWKNMQQNLMRWFFRAYVNRLGAHLIELYSGRLAIGADQYRRLTRRGRRQVEESAHAPVVVVAGARKAGKTLLIDALARARSGDLASVRARLAAAGLDEDLADRLGDLQWLEVPGYKVQPGPETARERATRREAVEEAVEADLLVLVLDAGRDELAEDIRFAQDWEAWFRGHPGLEVPPALAVLVGGPRAGRDGASDSGAATGLGKAAHEAALGARLEAVKAQLPPTFAEVLAVGDASDPAAGVAERILPALAALLHRAERVALIRHLHDLSTRSKARRLFSQVGRQGRRLLGQIRTARAHRQQVG
jgi:hypothetical protein